jgi:hypothetical protein
LPIELSFFRRFAAGGEFHEAAGKQTKISLREAYHAAKSTPRREAAGNKSKTSLKEATMP